MLTKLQEDVHDSVLMGFARKVKKKMRRLLMIYIDGQLQHFAGPIVQMSLMEPTLDDNDKSDTGVTLDTNAKEETEAVELLRVELVLNVPPKEEGSKFS